MIAIVDNRSLAELARHVSRTLDVQLHARESSYYGDPYYGGSAGSDLKLTLNEDPQFREGDPPEERRFAPHAPDAPYLLWEAEDEADVVERLRAAGLDARVVADS
jgi:hypothetical protein